MILDLNAPFPEKSVYKYPSQRETWGTFLLFHDFTLLFSRDFLESIFPKRKRKLIQNLLSQIGNPYLRSFKLLACWNQLGVI